MDGEVDDRLKEDAELLATVHMFAPSPRGRRREEAPAQQRQ